MKLAFRIALFAYAAAFAIVAFGVYSLHSDNALWPSTASTALAYLFFAIGYAASRGPDRNPSRLWVTLGFLATCLLLGPILLSLFYETPIPSEYLRLTVVIPSVVLVYLAIAVLMLRDMRSAGPHLRLRRILVPILLLSGAACVFYSLRLQVTDTDHPGWDIIRGKTPWITAHISVATGLFTGNELSYLHPFYAHGRIIYILALLATVALLIWFAVARFSINRRRDSSLLTVPAIALILAGFWVVTDIYWGWHFDLHESPWAAIIATALWLTAPILAAVLLIPLHWRGRETWRLYAFVLLQLPIAAFNVMQLQAYYGSDSLHFEGLGTLIIGLQLETWACLDLLAHREKNELELLSEKNPASDHSVAEVVRAS
jgi:hypothetical protein